MVEFPLLGQALSIEFSNTLWVHRGRVIDALITVDGTTRWLTVMAPRLDGDADDPHGSSAIDVDEGLRGRLVALRESVRDLFTAVAAAATPEPRVLARLAAVSRAAPSWLEGEPRPEGRLVATRRRGGSPGQALLAAIADDAVALATGPEAGYLRSCPGPGCIGFFIQDSARRKFCSPTCSTRWRVARYYSRRRKN